MIKIPSAEFKQFLSKHLSSISFLNKNWSVSLKYEFFPPELLLGIHFYPFIVEITAVANGAFPDNLCFSMISSFFVFILHISEMSNYSLDKISSSTSNHTIFSLSILILNVQFKVKPPIKPLKFFLKTS